MWRLYVIWFNCCLLFFCSSFLIHLWNITSINLLALRLSLPNQNSINSVPWNLNDFVVWVQPMENLGFYFLCCLHYRNVVLSIFRLMSIFLFLYRYNVNFYVFFDNLMVLSSQVQSRVLNHEYRYWLFQIGYRWTYWWIHSGIDSIYGQWFFSFFYFLIQGACLPLFGINNPRLMCNFGEWQDESTTLADMKRVWSSRKFSYIYEACPSTNQAFFMQSLYAHCIGNV